MNQLRGWCFATGLPGSTIVDVLFVSSTYIDLIAERQAVRQILEARGTDAVGGMECYFSEPRESLEVCLQWVAQAHALVVIVA